MNTEIIVSKGSFYERDGKIYVQASIDGKTYKRSTKKVANDLNKRWAKKTNPSEYIMQLLGKKTNREKANISFEEFGYACISARKKTSKATYDDHIRIFKNIILPYFKSFHFEDFTVISVKEFLNTLSLCKDRNMRIKNDLYEILETAYDEGLIEKNLPLSKILRKYKFPKTIIKTEAYSVSEVKKMLEESTGWFSVYLELALKYGLRPSEMILIKWGDLDLYNGLLSIKRSWSDKKVVEATELTETNKNHLRDFYLFPETIEKLKAYFKVRPHNEWLFISKYNTHFKTLDSLRNSHMGNLLRKLKIEYKGLYAARRSYNSIMTQSKQIKKSDIQNVMGHATGSKIGDEHYNLDCLAIENKKAIALRQAKVFNEMLQEASD